ncbi:MAG: hypothetical protein H7Z40_08050 [Phycisphaerae bacterium]|nr:hypothetical protein [Gemmatimonadaceae bacterium]
MQNAPSRASNSRAKREFLIACTRALLAVACVAPLTGAQSSTAANADSTASGWNAEQCLGGLTYGAPLKLAASWAGGLRKELENGQNVCAFVSPKVGLGGARLGVGFARTTGTFGGGVAASAAVIRTFGSPSYADRQSTYAGAWLHYFPLLGIGLELGWYKRLGGVSGRGRESIIAWSAGIGF